jgi:hypothetical protein
MHTYICQQCSKEFQSKEIPQSKNNPKFCSRECFDFSKRKIKDVQKAIALYESGMSQTEIAEQLGVTSYNIYRAFKRAGYKIPRKTTNKRTGEKNPNWSGGIQIGQGGYIKVKCPGHPRANPKRGNYVPQHILVMERYLGRYLEWHGQNDPNNEVVHHINHNTQDNRIENLQLMKEAQHRELHSKEALIKTSKPVRRMDTGEVYPSAVQADRAMGYPLNTIARAARLGYKTERKISWEYIQN